MHKISRKNHSLRSGKSLNGIVIVVFLLALGVFFLWKYDKVSNPTPRNEDSAGDTAEVSLIEYPLSENADGTLAFSPEKISSSVGQTFSLDVKASPGKNNLNGAELHIKYDPTKMKVSKIQPSERFSLELQAAKIDATKGEASIALGVPLQDSSISNGDQTIATFSFVSLESSTSSTVEFLSTSLLSAEKEMKNVLKLKKTAEVVIFPKQ